MTLQKNVYDKQALGIVGEMADSSISRVNSHVALTKVTIGRAVTQGTGGVNAGGTGAFAGIIVSPKTLALQGLDPSLEVAANTQVEACTFGRLYVVVTNTANVGDTAFFSTDNGSISAGEAGATVSGSTEIVGSKFLTDATVGLVCVLQLTTDA